LLCVVLALAAGPAGAAVPTVSITGGGQAASGKSLPFTAKVNVKLGTRFALELRGIDLKRSPRSSFNQPEYRDPRTCKRLPCSWGVTSQVPIDYEFRAFLVDPRNGTPIAASAGVRGIWSSGPQPHGFRFFVNGKPIKLGPIDGSDNYIEVPSGKARIETRWTTDAGPTAFSVVVSTVEPTDATYATCKSGTVCRVPVRVPIGKGVEMSWHVSVVTKRGRQLVIGYQACLLGV
jgi:hypothetical protein